MVSVPLTRLHEPSLQANATTRRYETMCNGCTAWEDCDGCTVHESDVDPMCSPPLDRTTAEAGATLRTLDIEEGYRRATSTSNDVLKCCNEEACSGGQTGSLEYIVF